MRGLDVNSTWTHLLPGLIVCGAGVGLVNPPLASTAIGVVDPRRAGMASGINSTFRQVGIATGIALLGSLFTSRFTSEVTSQAAQVPSLAGNGSKIAAAVQSGGASQALGAVPASARAQVRHITVSSFTTGLNYILLVAAIIAITAGVVAFMAIRQKDFVYQQQPAT
jgi:hypothetical protein